MVNLNRTTVYLNPKVHRALKVKAATTDSSISQLVNRAVLEVLKEDVIDLKSFRKRAKEPVRPLKKVLAELERDGQL